jgi:hypothetical protein
MVESGPKVRIQYKTTVNTCGEKCKCTRKFFREPIVGSGVCVLYFISMFLFYLFHIYRRRFLGMRLGRLPPAMSVAPVGAMRLSVRLSCTLARMRIFFGFTRNSLLRYPSARSCSVYAGSSCSSAASHARSCCFSSSSREVFVCA